MCRFPSDILKYLFENQVLTLFTCLSRVFNMVTDKPCANSSVNTIVKHFLLKTAVYQRVSKIRFEIAVLNEYTK